MNSPQPSSVTITINVRTPNLKQATGEVKAELNAIKQEAEKASVSGQKMTSSLAIDEAKLGSIKRAEQALRRVAPAMEKVRMTSAEFRSQFGGDVDEIVRKSVVGANNISKAAISSGKNTTAATQASAKTAIKAEEDAARKIIQLRQRSVSAGASLLGLVPGGNNLAPFLRVGNALDRVQQQAKEAKGALAEVGNQSTATGGALAALGGGAGLTAIGIGLVIAAGVGAVAVGYNLAKSFAEAGEQIYQARLKTGANTETLSLLRVAAELTGKSFEQATTGLSRYLKNTVEAANGNDRLARTFKSVGFTSEEIKRAAHDGEFALEKLFDVFQKLPAGPEKTAVAMRLVGKSGQELLGIIDNLGGSFGSLKEKAASLGLIFSKEDVAAAHQFTLESKLLGLAWEGLTVTVGRLALPLFIKLLGDLNHYVQQNRDSIKAWAEYFVTGLSYIITGGQQAVDILRSIYHEYAAVNAFAEARFSDGYKELQESDRLIAQIHQRAVDFKNGKGFKIEIPDLPKTGASDLKGLGKTKKAKHQLSEYEQLFNQYKKLVFDINSFLQTNSKEFNLRIKVEDAQKFKSELEKIISLRRELSLPLTDTLPKNPQAAKALVEELESFKRVQDAVRKTQEESRTASEQLAEAILTKNIPVIDAETRADIAYNKAVRERRNAERQLTADLITQSRLRRDALADEVGETLKAYTELRLDAIKQAEETRVGALKEHIKLLTNLGQEGTFRTELEAKLRLIEPENKPHTTAVEQISSNVEKILTALTTGKVDNPAGSEQPFNAGQGTGRGGRFNRGAEFNAGAVRQLL